MLQNVKEQLSALKLHGMAEALEMQIRTPMSSEMDFAARLLLLVQHEKSMREIHKLTTLLRQARNMSTKMSHYFKKNHSTLSGFRITSRITFQCLTGREPQRSGCVA